MDLLGFCTRISYRSMSQRLTQLQKTHESLPARTPALLVLATSHTQLWFDRVLKGRGQTRVFWCLVRERFIPEHKRGTPKKGHPRIVGPSGFPTRAAQPDGFTNSPFRPKHVNPFFRQRLRARRTLVGNKKTKAKVVSKSKALNSLF